MSTCKLFIYKNRCMDYREKDLTFHLESAAEWGAVYIEKVWLATGEKRNE